jgi:predicted HicB family RNase H-like nuclease
MASTAHLTVRISPELREKIVELAKADRRTVSQWTALRLEEVVAEIERKNKKPTG